MTRARFLPLLPVLAALLLTSPACTSRAVSILQTDIRDLQNRIYEMQKRQAENQVAIQDLREQLLSGEQLPAVRTATAVEGPGSQVESIVEPEVPGSTFDLGDEGPVRDVTPVAPGPSFPSHEESTAIPGLEKPNVVGAPPPPEGGMSDELYVQGYSQFNTGNYQSAQQSFQEFLAQAPESDLADDAQYWVGECFLALKDYRRSILEFRRVIDQYPFGNRVPHSFLKIGLAYLALGDEQRAAENLETVVEAFPRSDVATVARATLDDIQGRR